MSYIERDGILKDLQEALEVDSIYYNDDVNKGITEGLKLAVKNIKRFPTSDVVEVRHGEWKDRHENKYANHYYECSVCGKPALDQTVYNGLGNPRQEQALSPFCPHCGAQMGGERREE